MLTIVVEKQSDEARRAAFGDALGDTLAVRKVTQRVLGERLGGITQSAISAWIAGQSEPSREMVFQIEQVLELPPGNLSRHLGYLPPSAADSTPVTFEDAVMNDPLLDETQKRGVLALYREFTGHRPAGRRRK